MKPAFYIVEIFGGVRATARALKLVPSTIVRWRTSKKRKGTGGKIPSKHHEAIMRIAKRKKLDITTNDIIFGRKI